jgi:hypothetical protein
MVGTLSFSRLLPGSLLTVMVLLLVGPATLQADQSLMPVVDCVVPQGISATSDKVYFGYTYGGVSMSVPFGDSNQVVPGIQFQGQPTVFNTGTYQRVFYAAWNPTAFQAIAWELNGFSAIANSTTPVCVSGITGTASDVTTSTATLHGDINIAGEQTTYHFEYGDDVGPSISTPSQTALPGPQQTISAPVADLTPGDTYHFRIVATNSDGTTEGALASFDTSAPSAPPVTTTVTAPSVTTTVTAPPVTTTVTVQTPASATTSPTSTTPTTATTTEPAAPPAVSGRLRFVAVSADVSAQALTTGARHCSLPVVAGVSVTTSQSAGVTVVASVAGVAVAQGSHASSGRPFVLVLCLNGHGRQLVRAQGRRFRALSTTIALRATSGAQSATVTVHTVFRPH